MKKYLCINDSEAVYEDMRSDIDNTLFGIQRNEQNFARLRMT